ncbi:5-oxoprolinase subunit PxpA [Aliikangiella sp. IMCC44653]
MCSSNAPKHSAKIDINCDLGEYQSKQGWQQDAQLMPFISRCNIACGGHAGDKESMQNSLLNARKFSVKAGAHPSYPDKANFGRISIKISQDELLNSIEQQIESLAELANSLAIQLTHIKLHGALYNDAESDPQLAQSILLRLKNSFPKLKILGLAGGATQQAAKANQQNFIREAFMDRGYQANGFLISRQHPKAMLDSVDAVIRQALNIATGQAIDTVEGQKLRISADSLCLHGDNSNAQYIARNLFFRLQQAGVEIT